MSTQKFDVVRSNVYNSHSVLVIIKKLKTKSSQKVDKWTYKIDMGSDDNLMSITL